jgi:hypothetical protein
MASVHQTHATWVSSALSVLDMALMRHQMPRISSVTWPD